MDRRKFLIGMGSAAAGSAAIVGSGAMNIRTVDREFSVDVVADDAGIVNFNVDGAPNPIVDIEDDKFRVDFAAAQGDGVNVDSEVVVGRSFESPLNGDNIRIENHSGRDFENVRYEFETGDDWEVSSEDTFIGFSVASDEDSEIMKADNNLSSGETVSMVVDGFDAGAGQQMNLKLSTIGASTDDNLSGSLTIETDYDGF